MISLTMNSPTLEKKVVLSLDYFCENCENKANLTCSLSEVIGSLHWQFGSNLTTEACCKTSAKVIEQTW